MKGSVSKYDIYHLQVNNLIYSEREEHIVRMMNRDN